VNEESLARRVRSAVESFELPSYPAGFPPALHGRGAASPVRARHRLAFALTAAVALAILGASAAFAVPNVLPDRLLRAFDRVGIHLRGAHFVSLDTRVVSLDEARGAADFAVIVPSNERLVKTSLSIDAVHHHALVALLFEDEGRNQIVLSESRVDPRHPYVAKPVFRVEADGHVRELPPPVAWRIGDTWLTIGPYDARSRAFAGRLKRETLASGRSSR
jgi:hypothetical protein